MFISLIYTNCVFDNQFEGKLCKMIRDKKTNSRPKYCHNYRLFLELTYSFKQPLRTAVKVGGKLYNIQLTVFGKTT